MAPELCYTYIFLRIKVWLFLLILFSQKNNGFLIEWIKNFLNSVTKHWTLLFKCWLIYSLSFSVRIYYFSFIVEKISQLNWISSSGILLTTFPPDGHLAVADEIKMVRIRAKTFIFEWERLLDREIYKMGPFVIFSTNFLLIYCQRFFYN